VKDKVMQSTGGSSSSSYTHKRTATAGALLSMFQMFARRGDESVFNMISAMHRCGPIDDI